MLSNMAYRDVYIICGHQVTGHENPVTQFNIIACGKAGCVCVCVCVCV